MGGSHSDRSVSSPAAAGRYRKKPVEISAFRLGIDPMPDWFCDAKTANDVVTINDAGSWGGGPDRAVIKTLEGEMTARFGDWVIRGVAGELYPCKPDIFAQTYEAVDAHRVLCLRCKAICAEEFCDRPEMRAHCPMFAARTASPEDTQHVPDVPPQIKEQSND